EGSFTVIIGPNACGKSTLLRALSRLLAPSAGRVVLDGRSIGEFPAKEVARRLGLLPQSSVAPDAITVADLVARGRYPHQ
ncbi:ATP-binding cassette domain-containing protein, partial [Klebsiella variicola]|uniref:ATP-binding cassette domain-containing protein n=2 Tax=Pseudomonadota TaxID=1224 RepID=UPI0039C14F1E